MKIITPAFTNTADSNNFKTSQIVGFFIAFASLIALFFTERWEVGFSTFWQHVIIWNEMNITVRNLALLALNIGTAVIIKASVKNIDERGAAIKNYVSKHTVRFAIGFALMMGVLLKPNANLLIYAAIVQAYYLILFKVCMYRDPAIVYMDEAQLKIYNKKMAKYFLIVLYSQSIILGGIGGYLVAVQHNTGAFILFLLICPFICSLAQVIYSHWKS